MLKINIYTDGSCIKNPGPGGCASIIKILNKEIILNSGYYYTTNNRMELMAIIFPLIFFIKINIKFKYYINIFTDSTYLYNGVNNWIYLWKKNNWKKSNNKFIKNVDLWKKIFSILILFKNKLKWNLIKSHSGNYYNNKCDKIAFLSANNPTFIDYNIYFSS